MDQDHQDGVEAVPQAYQPLEPGARDIELSLLSKIAATQSLGAVSQRVIEPRHFRDPDCRDVFDWIQQQVRRYRAVPSMNLLKRRWPKRADGSIFFFPEVSDTLEMVLDEFVRLVKRRGVIDGCRQMAEVADDPSRVVDAEIYIFEIAAELARSMPSSSVTRFSESLNRLELYRERERTGQTPGVSMVVPQLNDLTYGIQGHEFAIIEGFLGQKKSTLGIMMAAEAYFLRGQTPLFVSMEMEGEKLAARWDAYAAKISYSALKRLELGEEDIAKWEAIGEKAADAKFEKDIVVLDNQRRPTSDWLYTEVERWRPDFTIVDTLDEIRAPSHLRSVWEQQDYVARELKGIARSTKRPLVGIAQAGRDAAQDGATLQNIAGSITIARKADIAVGLHSSPAMKAIHRTDVTLLKNRDDKGEGTVIPLYWNVGTTEMRDWRPSDNMAARPVATEGSSQQI